MQKVINVIALLSGLTSATLIGGAGYFLMNKDKMIEEAKQQAIEEVTKTVTGSVTGKLPGMIKSAIPPIPPAPPAPEIPKFPSKTGPVLDFEKGFTGPAIPKP